MLCWQANATAVELARRVALEETSQDNQAKAGKAKEAHAKMLDDLESSNASLLADCAAVKAAQAVLATMPEDARQAAQVAGLQEGDAAVEWWVNMQQQQRGGSAGNSRLPLGTTVRQDAPRVFERDEEASKAAKLAGDGVMLTKLKGAWMALSEGDLAELRLQLGDGKKALTREACAILDKAYVWHQAVDTEVTWVSTAGAASRRTQCNCKVLRDRVVFEGAQEDYVVLAQGDETWTTRSMTHLQGLTAYQVGVVLCADGVEEGGSAAGYDAAPSNPEGLTLT